MPWPSCESAYAGLSAEQIKERIRETLKDNPLWRQRSEKRVPSPSRKEMGDCPS
jgi:hypothetical protein